MIDCRSIRRVKVDQILKHHLSGSSTWFASIVSLEYTSVVNWSVISTRQIFVLLYRPFWMTLYALKLIGKKWKRENTCCSVFRATCYALIESHHDSYLSLPSARVCVRLCIYVFVHAKTWKCPVKHCQHCKILLIMRGLGRLIRTHWILEMVSRFSYWLRESVSNGWTTWLFSEDLYYSNSSKCISSFFFLSPFIMCLYWRSVISQVDM